MSAAQSTPSRTGVVAWTVFLMYLGLMILNPLIAPLSRELHLAEWQIGAVVSAALSWWSRVPRGAATAASGAGAGC